MPPDDTIILGEPGSGQNFSDDAPGTQVGPYKLVSLLGEGGFGSVWLAERRHPFVQRVALKIVKAGMDSKAVVARFEQERQALAVMNHPHVAKVLDGGLTARGRPYFAMEYVNGEPISDFCDRQKLPLKERLRLFLQVCEAVQHAHTKGIIHRDLKPSNVLVSMGTDDQPSAKVIDFGIAKAVSGRMTEQTLFTETGQMMGTPEYMSPEQADPGATDIDTRTDVYSLGVILYELLTGALPFDPKDLRSRAYREIQRVIREEDPPTPSARLSTIATRDADLATKIGQARKEPVTALASLLKSELEWIPLKAMRKERGERYDSPASLARDVENYLDGRPLVAAPESAAYRVRKYVRRNRGFVAATATVLAALVVGLGLATWQWRAAVASERKARESEFNAMQQLERSNELLGLIAAGGALDAVRRSDIAGTRRELALLKELGRDGRFAARLARAWSDGSLGQPLRGHEDMVVSLAFSPDGKTLASGGADNLIRLWDVVAGKAIGEPLGGHEGVVSGVAFSPDGKMLASAGGEATIRLWDAGTGKPLGEPLNGRGYVVLSVAFSPDGNVLASGCADRAIRLWSVPTRKALGEPLRGHGSSITNVIFCPDGRTFASAGGADSTVRLWDATTGTALGEPLGQEGTAEGVAFSPDGKVLASAGGDASIRLWNVESGQAMHEPLRGHEGVVSDVAFSPDGKMLASAGFDKTIRLWDPGTGKPLGEPLRGHEGVILSVAFSPDGRLLASGGGDGTIRLWDVVAAAALDGPLRGHESGGSLTGSNAAFSPDGRVLATGGADGTICLWDVVTGKALGGPLRGHPYEVTSVAFSPDGRTLASTGHEPTIRLWDTATGKPLGEPLRGHERFVLSVAFSPDGKTLASGSQDATIRLWDARTGKAVLEPLHGHEDVVSTVAFSPDGKLLASGGADKTIRVWDAGTGKALLEPLRGHEDVVLSVAFSPDSGMLASGGFDSTIRLWDLGTGRAFGEPRHAHDGMVSVIAFSPDGKSIASGGFDGAIRLWDVGTGNAIGEPLGGHEGLVCGVAFSADGSMLASVSNVVRLWSTVPIRERAPPYHARMAEVAQVRARLATRIAAVDDSIASVQAFSAEVRADPRFEGDLRTAALIVVGEVALDRESRRGGAAKPASAPPPVQPAAPRSAP
jgi:WD40 repeat protein/serine/threonine protein kinase